MEVEDESHVPLKQGGGEMRMEGESHAF